MIYFTEDDAKVAVWNEKDGNFRSGFTLWNLVELAEKPDYRKNDEFWALRLPIELMLPGNCKIFRNQVQ